MMDSRRREVATKRGMSKREDFENVIFLVKIPCKDSMPSYFFRSLIVKIPRKCQDSRLILEWDPESLMHWHVDKKANGKKKCRILMSGQKGEWKKTLKIISN
jgi:hypothetical protein